MSPRQGKNGKNKTAADTQPTAKLKPGPVTTRRTTRSSVTKGAEKQDTGGPTTAKNTRPQAEGGGSTEKGDVYFQSRWIQH